MSCGWLLRPVALLTGLGLLAVGPSLAVANEWTFQTGAHVDAWSGAGQDGHQVLAPFVLSYDTPDWGLSVRGAYGTYERSPADLPSGTITGLTDTTLGGYYRLTVSGIDLNFGLAMDLPTGVSKLRNDQLT